MGAALMAVGGLIAALCCACTVVLITSSIADSIRYGLPLGQLTQSFGLVLAIGGAPTVIGALILMAGWRMYRRGDR